MQRVIGSKVINFRRVAWSVGGASSLAAGYGIWKSKTPILLDSSIDQSRWDRKVEINASDDTLSQQFKQASEAQQANRKLPSKDDGLSTWQTASVQISAVCGSLVGLDFSSLSDKIKDYIVPSWIRGLPGLVNKLQNELSMAPWSLSWEIWEDAHNAEINPEILWDAQVRVSEDLCPQEQEFLKKRSVETAKALARYLGLTDTEIDPRDVPRIAMIGSGGGLRALVAGTSSYLSAHEAGLFDCVTYTAGVSGSCWLQTLYYSSIGQLSHQRLIDHLKQRIGVHIAYPPAALDLLNQAPTNKFLLSGFVEKLRGVPDADFGLVDVYGLLLAARLMVPKGELRVSDYDMKVSNQRSYIEDGAQPMPIYTAVRHEIPDAAANLGGAKEQRFSGKQHFDYFQWFEWTPYEFFCDELNAGIPTWAIGRRFNAGRTVWRQNGLALPELRIPLMLGIWGSAFCATLSHYYKEIRPLVKAGGLGSLDALLTGKNEDLVKVHPIDPAVIPNFLLGLEDKLPTTCPESIHSASHLQLMDAGMSNNLPIYPLLRRGRDVDVIIAFDASADVKTDNWIKVVDGYVKQRRITGWPMGAGWPPADESPKEIEEDIKAAEAAAVEREDARQSSTMQDLGHCTVWVGTKEEGQEYMDDPPARRLHHDDSDDDHLRDPRAGIALVYFPFIKNEKVPTVDPLKSEYLSTWNFVYTPEEVDSVVQLARANFDAGQEQTKRTIRAVWERKKAARLQRELEEHEYQRLARIRIGHAQHGDQFS